MRCLSLSLSCSVVRCENSLLLFLFLFSRLFMNLMNELRSYSVSDVPFVTAASCIVVQSPNARTQWNIRKHCLCHFECCISPHFVCIVIRQYSVFCCFNSLVFVTVECNMWESLQWCEWIYKPTIYTCVKRSMAYIVRVHSIVPLNFVCITANLSCVRVRLHVDIIIVSPKHLCARAVRRREWERERETMKWAKRHCRKMNLMLYHYN